MRLSGDAVRADVRERRRRLSIVAPTIVQTALAAGLAWVIAKDVLAHSRPFFAPIAVVLCIGVAVGRRLRRLAEMVVGVSVGVGVGDLLIARIGSGWWQLALVVALAMAVAVFLDSGTTIVLQAGTSAVLVATLLPPSGSGGLDRMVDALLGGVLGVVAVALFPASPFTIVHRRAGPLFEALADALEATADALARHDMELGAEALGEARRTQSTVDDFNEALQTSKEITRISPLYRHRREHLARYQTAATHVDHALRNTRVLLRRANSALRVEHTIPTELPGALADLAAATRAIRRELAEGREPVGARSEIISVAARVRGVHTDREDFSAYVLTAQLRSVIVDLLQATGTDYTTALSALPRIDTHGDGQHGAQPRSD
ncbi:FUSC family protein [Spongiactinospora sp. TRM90649]|uniref:FUSC family protein n=1 Tax=Spongiactinospora sp. TRM90649 TaxID=3031114 RepID=UPI0023F9C834|nr:FUSC family protein [Spongiactinospora sp. TRM90649]MDF5757776.1 FUSC family protein [Spongiactinospora sp. TRM90649]